MCTPALQKWDYSSASTVSIRQIHGLSQPQTPTINNTIWLVALITSFKSQCNIRSLCNLLKSISGNNNTVNKNVPPTAPMSNECADLF